MKAKEFYDRVVDMRAKQKRYSKTHSKTALAASMRAEKVIDTEIERVTKVLASRAAEGVGGENL